MRYHNFGLLRKARKWAFVLHSGQFRKETFKGKRISYSFHPTGVAEYLDASGAEDESIAAGYLHDVFEDTDTTYEEIAQEFGKTITDLVMSVTEPKGKTWQERKEFKINSLRQGSIATKMLGAADHCDNLLSILDVLKQAGLNTPEEFAQSDIWSNFHQPYDKQKWYHQTSCLAIFENVPLDKLPPLFGKLMRLVEQIFGENVILDPEIRRKVRRRNKDWINPYSFEPPRKIKKPRKPSRRA
jgi:hypothetical protein